MWGTAMVGGIVIGSGCGGVLTGLALWEFGQTPSIVREGIQPLQMVECLGYVPGESPASVLPDA